MIQNGLSEEVCLSGWFEVDYPTVGCSVVDCANHGGLCLMGFILDVGGFFSLGSLEHQYPF